jgi:hypothetical protein
MDFGLILVFSFVPDDPLDQRQVIPDEKLSLSNWTGDEHTWAEPGD